MKRKSYSGRVACVVLLIVMITLMITMGGSYYYVRKNLTQSAISNGERSVAADGSALEVYLSSLRRDYMAFYYNANIYSLLYEDNLDFDQQTTLFAFLQSLFNLSDSGEISQIYVDLYRSDQSFLLGSYGRSHGEDGDRIDIPEDVQKYYAWCEGNHPGHSYGLDEVGSEREDVCSFHWNFYDAIGTEVIGTLSVDVYADQLSKYISDASQRSPVYILNQDGSVIYGNSDLLTTDEIDALMSEEDRWTEIHRSDFRGMAFSHLLHTKTADWQLIELRTSEELFSASSQILRMQVILFLIALIACAVSTMFIIYRLTMPLREISEYALAVEKGDLHADLRNYTKYDRPDELGILIGHMRSMMEKVNDMFRRQEQLSRAHRSAEMKMLLAQINPHFIYNTLQSISTLALLHKDPQVYQLLTKLGAEMQYSMDLEQSVADLAQEARYTDSYLALQQQRFNDRFRYEIHVARRLESMQVPRMMLQPLAENAIKHGQIHRQEDGFLRIRADWEDGWCVITLEDNGLGCPENRMEELNERFALPEEDEAYVGEHIGMRNVNYRLKLLYGEETRMWIERSAWGGACIRVRIPLEEKTGGTDDESIDRG